MEKRFSRTGLLIGDEGITRLGAASVAVFGIGGVGGYVVEALARAGVGRLAIFDADRICETNINRQIIACFSTLGMYKVDAMAKRVMDINPAAVVMPHRMFYSAENSEQVNLSEFDYVVDAIDTVSCKIELIIQAHSAGIPIISCMGTGNKFDPSAFVIADIYKTDVCPLAKVMRHELRKRGIESLKVVFSKEPPQSPRASDESVEGRRQIPGSVSFVPAAAGLVLAGGVIKDLLKI